MVVFKVKKTIKSMMIIIICIILMMFVNIVYAAINTNLPVSKILDTFPTSYQPYIDNLKTIYPNATFKAIHTGLDWNTVLQHESYEVNVGISTIHKSYDASWKRDGTNNFVDGPYVTASKEAIAYVLDPRNSLTEKHIFQFELLTYTESMNEAVIEKVLSGTELVGKHKDQYQSTTEDNWIPMGMTYSELIAKVAKELNVSSVYIASRMVQETGGKISTNGSISGIFSGYEGLYNFFNVGASPNSDGTGAITNGLKYAKSKKWTTPYLSIYGGVDIIKSKYIKYGQYTVYFQKFDVNNPYANATVLMKMQYQTNLIAPRSESLISYAAYNKLGLLSTAFVFYIPVYNNMPNTASPIPGTVTSQPSKIDINISDSGITGVNPGTTVDELKSKIVADNMTIVIKNTSGNALSNTDNVGTGCTVELHTAAGEIAESYPVTIYGDIDGDGTIDSADLLLLRQHMSNNRTLTGLSFKAANIYREDSIIDSSDLLLLRQHMSNKRMIEQ